METIRQKLHEQIEAGYKFIVLDEINGIEYAILNNNIFKDELLAMLEVSFQKTNYNRDCLIIPIDAPILEG